MSKINDFVVRFANVNGTGSASANYLFAKAIFRMGIFVSPKNIFPSNIQGLPTWYEVRVSDKGWLGRREGVDLAKRPYYPQSPRSRKSGTDNPTLMRSSTTCVSYRATCGVSSHVRAKGLHSQSARPREWRA